MGATLKFAVENFNSLRPGLERMVADAEPSAARGARRRGRQGVVLREPVGVVAGVTPWNSPVAVGAVQILPSLLMGCPIVIKPRRSPR